MLLGLMAYAGATMTLPGIAGFILTIGMGVDSNVLIFERIKEELATAQGREAGGRRRLRSRAAHHSRYARRVADLGGVPLQLRHRPDPRLRADAHDWPARQRVHGLLRFPHHVRADAVAPHRSRSSPSDLWLSSKTRTTTSSSGAGTRIALSAIIIIAGLAYGIQRGIPLGIDFSGGTHPGREVRAAGHRRPGAQALVASVPASRSSRATATPAQNQKLIRLPQLVAEEGARARSERARRGRRADQGQPRQVRGASARSWSAR